MFNIKQINHATSNQRDRKIKEDLSAHLKGAIISKRNGEVTSFEAISGSIKGIELKEHEYENKKFRNWHILLSDTESGEDYDISVSRDSGVFKSIVRSLVTEQGLENLNDVKIEVYTSKTGFTNAVVSAGGQKLHWTDEPMQAVRYVTVGENEVADNTAQMNWIQTLVDRINAKLTEPVSVTEASDEDDLPEEFYN